MKLLTKYARITTGTSVIVFLVACFAFLPFLNNIFIGQVDENLLVEKDEIMLYAKKYQHLPEIMPVRDQETTFEAVEFPENKSCWFETIYKGGRSFRKIQFTITIASGNFLVTIEKSLDRTRNLAYSLLALIVSTIFLVLLFTFLINRFVIRRLWNPFYTTVLKVKQFQISQAYVPALQSTDIEEFRVLNQTLQEAAEKALREYITLKEFTENAGHELQTPIAVIRAKLDTFIQDESLSAAQSQAVHEAYAALERLYKLNRALIFSVKIDNRQFDDAEEINIKLVIELAVSHFTDLLQSKNITIKTDLDDISIHVNSVLAHSIIDNLLINSIIHNHPGGSIYIKCDASSLCISNSGKDEPLDASRIFERFYKQSSSSESQGLGLAIVKQICDRLHFRIAYAYDNHLHSFCVYFA